MSDIIDFSCTYDNSTSLLGMGHGVRAYAGTDRRMDSHVTTKMLEINGLTNFPKYGAPLAWSRRTGCSVNDIA